MSSLSSDTVVHVCKLAATVDGIIIIIIIIIAMIAASSLAPYTHKPPLCLSVTNSPRSHKVTR